VALEHAVCPYYLGQEMVRWSDVVVADYNYYFDRSAMLHAMTVDGDWRVGGAGRRGAQPVQPRLQHVQRNAGAARRAGGPGAGARTDAPPHRRLAA
jgi:hypothetical protein